MTRFRGIVVLVAIAVMMQMASEGRFVIAKDKQGDEKQDDPKNGDKDQETHKEKDDVHPWQKVKSFSGAAKVKPKELKFLVTTAEWRLTFATEPDGDSKE